MILVLFLIVAAVLTLTAFFIARAHFKPSTVGSGSDVFTGYARKVEKDIKDAGISMSKGAYYAILVAAPIGLALAAYYFIGGFVIATVAGIAGLLVPSGIVALFKRNRQANFERYFLRSLEQMEASLRSGSSVVQAVEDTANCKFVHPSLQSLYAKMAGDMHMGIGIPEAFRAFADETGNADAADVATAIEIQVEAGSREAEVIKEIINNIKDRIMTRKEVRSLFSGESSMIWIMDFVTPCVIIFLTATSESYTEIYFSSPAMLLLYIAFFALSLTGTVINHRILKRLQRG